MGKYYDEKIEMLYKKYIELFKDILLAKKVDNINNNIFLSQLAYEPLRKRNGSIVSTNILYTPNAQQRQKITEEAKNNKNNKLLQYCSNQINRKITNISSQNIIEISQKDLEPQL